MLDEQGRKILEVLVAHLPKVRAGKPETYLGYKKIHEILGLPQLRERWGESLKVQGLSSLAEWTKSNELPAITGLIISMETYEPGEGYFSLFNKSENIYEWWKGEIEKSKAFDWSPYIQEEFNLVPADLTVPDRKDITISRIIRDTPLSRRVKSLNNQQCQICGISIEMPAGKKYSEAHHIKPLGQPHNGPDIIENMICVCPNHHAMLDYGAIKLVASNLLFKPNHSISEEFINYHNEYIHKP
ncbi:HNH endonuclease [Methylotenera versatilis]|uniref:HNH endonuclease n=1 Tax=Methylotenera versatilis TaxID=1055487 RepID=UPI00068C6CEC|nr:HNH endonuclease [Methylotenera versatilis]